MAACSSTDEGESGAAGIGAAYFFGTFTFCVYSKLV